MKETMDPKARKREYVYEIEDIASVKSPNLNLKLDLDLDLDLNKKYGSFNNTRFPPLPISLAARPQLTSELKLTPLYIKIRIFLPIEISTVGYDAHSPEFRCTNLWTYNDEVACLLAVFVPSRPVSATSTRWMR
jgi:hypothetical protein